MREPSTDTLRVCILLALSISLHLAAPALAQERTPVVVWHAYRQGGPEEAALRAAARAFERERRELRVVLVAQPYGAYASKLESAIPTGNGPDLFIDAHERLPSFREGGLVEEMSALDAELEARLEPAHLEVLMSEGALHGLPIAVKCAALYVNEALVREDPSTLEALAALRLPEGVFPLVMEAESPYWAASLVHAYGAELLTEDGRWGLEGEAAERAIAHLLRLVREGTVPEEASGELVPRLFGDARAATAISGPWLAPDLPEGMRWHVIPLPRVAATGAPMRPFATIESVFLAARARRPEAARAFARFITLGEGARVRAVRGRQIVTDREAWSHPELANDAFLTRFREASEAAIPLPVHPNMRAVWVPVLRALRKVLRGSASVEDALREGRRRFEDETRPLPPPRDPTWGLVFAGLLMLVALGLLVRRLADAEVRASLRRSLPAYRYVAHAVIAVGLLVILPLAVGAGTSFFSGRGFDLHYVGIDNYVAVLTARGGELLGTGSFWIVLLVTVLWTVINITLHVSIGVALALLLHRPYLHLKAFYRVALILPWAVPNYVTALAWKGMFHRQFGAVNALLTSLGAEPVSWFSQWITAFSANVATNVWLGFPFMMVVTLGALTAIPKDVYEAAAVDGASPWQRFRLITLPMLRPFLAPAVAMGSVWTFNMFNVVFLVSGGEPDGSTEILVSEAYRWAFTRGHQYGYAAAYAVLIFFILLFGTRALSPRASAGNA